jgi:hypothetical protein
MFIILQDMFLKQFNNRKLKEFFVIFKFLKPKNYQSLILLWFFRQSYASAYLEFIHKAPKTVLK